MSCEQNEVLAEMLKENLLEKLGDIKSELRKAEAVLEIGRPNPYLVRAEALLTQLMKEWY